LKDAPIFVTFRGERDWGMKLEPEGAERSSKRGSLFLSDQFGEAPPVSIYMQVARRLNRFEPPEKKCSNTNSGH